MKLSPNTDVSETCNNMMTVLEEYSVASVMLRHTLLEEMGTLAVLRMRERMLQPKTGETTPYLGGDHTASAIGEAPSVKSGELYKNTQYDLGTEGYSVDVGYGAETPYGKFLEYGTEFMDFRPNIYYIGQDVAPLIPQHIYMLRARFNIH